MASSVVPANCAVTHGRALTQDIAATRDSGQLLLYPRAAIKQTMKFHENSADIVLDFNSNTYWYFRGSNLKTNDMEDFECKFY